MSQSYTLDTTPDVALGLALATDSGISGSDRISNVGTMNITGLVAGNTWQYSTNAGGAWSTGTGTSFTVPAGNYASGDVLVKQIDAAGNSSTATSAPAITIDSTATSTITGVAYNAGSDTITLTGTNFNTLLESSEGATTDIKSRLDWSKLLWDINGDGATTANVSFTEAESNTSLTITLDSAKAVALEGAAGYDAFATNDKLVVTAGFLGDTAGNVATGDAFTGPSYINTSTVVFDFVEGISSSHSSRAFSAGVAYTIYIRVNSNSLALSTDGTHSNAAVTGESWGTWSGGANLGADDKIVLVGSGTSVLNGLGNPVGNRSLNGSTVRWNSALGSGIARLTINGVFRRWYGANSDKNILVGRWGANPDMGSTLNNIYLVDMPAGVLTSQGLA
jgi:hypothetical protein